MVISMARQKWTPETATAEQAQGVAAVERAFRQAKAWERVGYAAIRTAQAAGVPMEYLVGRTGRSQATVYRHVDQADSDAPEPMSLGDLPADVRRFAERELRKVGWSDADFVAASYLMLRANPKPYLERLRKVRDEAG